MPFIESNATSNPTKIYYEDCGDGRPIVLVHGWPVSHRMWENQISALTDAGFRCIAYDRRGFGESEKPWDGYNYDVMSADVHELIEALDLHDAILAGFSMGGGEVARYFGQFGSDRLSKAMLISSVTPYMLKTKDNPGGGLEKEDVEEMRQGVLDDRIAFLDDFLKQFLNWSEDNQSVSKPLLHYIHTIASFASPKATVDCITAFAEADFRDDLKKIDVPTLIVHGKADQVLPPEASAKRSAEMISDNRLEMIDGAPHGLNYTHKEQLNKLMIDFIQS